MKTGICVRFFSETNFFLSVSFYRVTDNVNSIKSTRSPSLIFHNSLFSDHNFSQHHCMGRITDLRFICIDS